MQLLNVLALLAFAAFGLFAIPKERREPWLWAAALWAVNPASIILERKIWTPSVLPLPAVGMLWAWRYRRHPAAAFAWGLLGALMAQIHLGAAFFAAALMAWTLVADRRAFPWIGWLAGSVVGVLPAIPWALDLAQHAWPHSPPTPAGRQLLPALAELPARQRPRVHAEPRRLRRLPARAAAERRSPRIWPARCRSS